MSNFFRSWKGRKRVLQIQKIRLTEKKEEKFQYSQKKKDINFILIVKNASIEIDLLQYCLYKLGFENFSMS